MLWRCLHFFRTTAYKNCKPFSRLFTGLSQVRIIETYMCSSMPQEHWRCLALILPNCWLIVKEFGCWQKLDIIVFSCTHNIVQYLCSCSLGRLVCAYYFVRTRATYDPNSLCIAGQKGMYLVWLYFKYHT